MLPLITVVVPAYNAAAYLPRTLDSILAQTYENLEILVVDDGSSDETAQVVAGYGTRVRYLPQAPSGGPSRPRNIGVKEARGELVAIFDSDDLMLPHKLADSARVMAEHSEVDLVFTNFAAIDAEDHVIRPDFLARYENFREHLTPTEDPAVSLLGGRLLYHQIIHANFIGTSSVLARRNAFIEVGGFDEEMKNADDVDMWCRLAWSGRTFAFLDRVCHQYRIHAGGMSARSLARKPSVIRFWNKQTELPLSTVERRRVNWALRGIWVNYARALRDAGQREEAIRAYRESLSRGLTRSALGGLARTLLMWSRDG